MSQYRQAVNKQYGRDDLSGRILKALGDSGKDIDNLTPKDIATFEEFHTGGKKETMNLTTLAAVDSSHTVLDLGCGIGGPARTLAVEYGCRVTGVDLTEEYCMAATMLTDRVGLSDRVDFVCADATDTGLPSNTFDIVWLQHMSMNIGDKAKLLDEISRLLKPKGKLAFHEILSDNPADLHYPVFWADQPELSTMIGPENWRTLLQSRFNQICWDDRTEFSLAWFEALQKKSDPKNPPPLSMGLIVGKEAPIKAANVIRNIREKKISIVQSVWQS